MYTRTPLSYQLSKRASGMAVEPYSPPSSISESERGGDLELMLHIREGNARALETLLHRYWTPLVRYAFRLLHSTDSAEDVVQETFVTVWKQRTNWKPVGTPQAFLYRMVRNRALHELRTKGLREQKAPELARHGRRKHVDTPYDIAIGKELHQALQQALACLPDRRREAFVLSRYHKLSLGEVAQIMGVSTQTVANHASMAAAELRRILERFLT